MWKLAFVVARQMVAAKISVARFSNLFTQPKMTDNDDQCMGRR